jgi:hypothetical protein
VLHRVGVDLQLRRELTNRWQGLSRLEHANRNAPLNFVHNLSEDRTPILRVDGQ